MKVSLVMIVGLLSLSFITGQAQDISVSDPHLYNELRNNTFLPLFAALRSGDITNIKRYLRGDLYDQYRVLFEQNKNYGQFLRDYYSGASFELKKVVKKDESYIADIAIHWKQGNSTVVVIQVTESSDAAQGNSLPLSEKQPAGWKVHDP